MSTEQRVAAYWNAIAEDFDAIYTGRNKSAFARFLDRTLRKDMYQRFAWVMSRCGDVAGQSVCDVGCGSGRFVASLARAGASRVVGVDVAPQMIQLARQLAAAERVANRCEFVVSDVADWQTNDVFDTTIAIGFWDYIEDPRGRLTRIRALTRGRFLSAWPRVWTWRMPIRKVRLGAAGCPVYFYRRQQVADLLAACGFSVDRIDVIGKLYCVEAHAAAR
jgi:SAM-dependent methyltransferase